MLQRRWINRIGFYTGIFAMFVCMHVFIFRGVIAKTPDIVRGDAVVAREELVPFFDFKTQFMSESTSDLTSSEEVRTSYSFWTSWVRQAKILPFALVILNSLSATILFYAFYRVTRQYVDDNSMAIAAAIASAIVIHLVLLYSKITHFYTLIFGFSMFALSMSLTIEQMFLSKHFSKIIAAVIILTVLANPGIHYHVIYYLSLALLIVVKLLSILLSHHIELKSAGKTAIRYIAYAVVLTFASLLPYTLMVSVLSGASSSSVTANIPINYSMIEAFSVPLSSILSLGNSSQVDMYLHGSYVLPSPRTVFFIYLAPVLFLLIYVLARLRNRRLRAGLLCLALLMITSAWMTIGYSQSGIISFHEILGSLTPRLYSSGMPFSHQLTSAIALFMNILRFPHRFGFIYFYVFGLLFSVGLTYLMLYAIRKTRITKTKAFAVSALFVLLPFVVSSDHRVVLTSGNFDGFLQPYSLPQDLKDIRSLLRDQKTDQKLLILPTLESGRVIEDRGYDYNFIDKFLIYYLATNTYYYGTGADVPNKIIADQIYGLMEAGGAGWEVVAAQNVGADHILQVKHTSTRNIGKTYLPNADEFIQSSLDTSKKYAAIYRGEVFDLYALNDVKAADDHTLVGVQDQHLGAVLEQLARKNTSFVFPLQWTRSIKSRSSYNLITDSPERSFYDLLVATGSIKPARPSNVLLPYRKSLVPSTVYTGNALALNVLDSSSDRYNYLRTKVPSLTGLMSSTFVGLVDSGDSLELNPQAPVSGRQTVALRAASDLQSIAVDLDDEPLTLHKIVEPGGENMSYSYYVASTEISRGAHRIIVRGTDESPIIVELAFIAKDEDKPDDYESYSNSAWSLKPSSVEGQYSISTLDF